MCNDVPEPSVPDTSTSQAMCPSPGHTPNPLISPYSSLCIYVHNTHFNLKTSVLAPALVLKMRPTLIRRHWLQPVMMPSCSAALNDTVEGHVAGKRYLVVTAGSRAVPVWQEQGVTNEAGPDDGRLVLDGGLPALVAGPLLDTSLESAKSRPHCRARSEARGSASGPRGMREAVRLAVPASHPRPVSGPGPQDRQGQMEVTRLLLGQDSSWRAVPFSVRPAHTEY